jgi:hypothetical protein
MENIFSNLKLDNNPICFSTLSEKKRDNEDYSLGEVHIETWWVEHDGDIKKTPHLSF